MVDYNCISQPWSPILKSYDSIINNRTQYSFYCRLSKGYTIIQVDLLLLVEGS